ncbi:hypothetical protein Mapa_001003 [Marchantia paleacea]|nr:hypothetical protein Mapa_001003 [Marchantia paleacea]
MALSGASLLVGVCGRIHSPGLNPKSLTALLRGFSPKAGVLQASIKQGKPSRGRFLHGCKPLPLRVSCSAAAKEGPLKHSKMVEKTAQATIVEHVVLFKIKDDVPAEKTEEIYKALGGLKNLDCVQDLSAGKALQILGGDYTHVLHSRHLTKDDLKAYATHSEHLAIVKNLLPMVDDILALDWVADPVGLPVDGGHGAARIALIKLADAITESESSEVFDLLYGLRDKFPFIRQVSAGLNFSPGRCKGLNVGFLALFNNMEELEQLNGNRELHSVLQKSKVAPSLDRFIVVDIGSK